MKCEKLDMCGNMRWFEYLHVSTYAICILFFNNFSICAFIRTSHLSLFVLGECFFFNFARFMDQICLFQKILGQKISGWVACLNSKVTPTSGKACFTECKDVDVKQNSAKVSRMLSTPHSIGHFGDKLAKNYQIRIEQIAAATSG